MAADSRMIKCPNCKNPIDEHEAGREMDACIAIVVMKWIPDSEHMDGKITYFNKSRFGKQGIRWDRARHTSTEIEEAWKVVEKIGNNNLITMTGYLYDGRENWWSVKLRGLGPIRASTVPLAICRAALNAVAND